MNTLRHPNLVSLIAASLFSVRALAGSIDTAPPVVIKTVPLAGAKDVDPDLKEIAVTFSKLMQNGGWSWVRWQEESTPEGTDKPHYLADKKTCVLPVKLEPGRFYAVWLNTDRFQNFKDVGGRPAIPYLLTFQTRPTK